MVAPVLASLEAEATTLRVYGPEATTLPSMSIGAEEIDDGERLIALTRVTPDGLPEPGRKRPWTTRRKSSA